MAAILGCCALAAVASAATSAAVAPLDRTAHVDSLRDSAGVMLYRVRCTDITVRVRNGRLISRDSSLFFTEQRKTEWASVVLKKERDILRDSLQTLTDSAGAFVAEGRFTRGALDSLLARVQSALERTINTFERSLHRLEDYQSVLNAVHPLLRRVSSP